MLREYQNQVVGAHKMLDITLTVAAYAGAYGFKKYLLPLPYGGLIDIPDYTVLGLLIIIIWYVSFNLFGMYSSYRNQTYSDIFWTMIKAVFTGMLFLGLCIYFLKITDVSRLMIGVFFFLNIVLLALSKGIVYAVMARVRKRGFNFRNILLVGNKEGAREVVEAIEGSLESGYKVLGTLDVDSKEIGKIVKNGIYVMNTVDAMESILRTEVVDQVIFCPPLKRIKELETCLLLAEEMGIPARIFPDWQVKKTGYEPKLASFRFETFLNIPMLTLTTGPENQGELFLKSVLDRVLAFLLLVLFSPFFLMIPIGLKGFSRGPVLFKQKRLGRNGRPFTMVKFRTMAVNAEDRQKDLQNLNESDGPVFKMRNDPRVLPVAGSLLRKTGLDELPQLMNVLKGEMSLVGPRPPVPEEVNRYDVWQRRRLSMKPGITCLWQVTPHRNDVCFGDWMKLDLAYIDNWSLWLDLKILLKTAWMMLSATGR